MDPWEERARRHEGEAALCLGFLLQNVLAGDFDRDIRDPRGDRKGGAWASEWVLLYTAAAQRCRERVGTPMCDHVLQTAGEGYFTLYQWCLRCGALFVRPRTA